MSAKRGEAVRRRRIAVGPGLILALVLGGLLGVSGAVTPSSPTPNTLSVDSSALSLTPPVQLAGLYGAVGSGNALLVNDQGQGFNANAPMPIAALGGGKADVITGALQTVLPDGSVRDLDLPAALQGQFATGNAAQPAALMDWDGVLNQVGLVDARASRTPIVVDGNLTLNANGSLTITSGAGTLRFDQSNWTSPANPLGTVLAWNGSRFTLDLSQTDTIIINGYSLPGSTLAESVGLDIRAPLTYQGVGALVVNVATGVDQRGIQVEGEAKYPQPNGRLSGTGNPVQVLAAQPGDGLALLTNGRIAVSQEGTGAGSFVPTVQGFLYAQGYRDASGQPHGIDIVGANLQGMAIGSRVSIRRLDSFSGIVTDRITIAGRQATMTIPPQVPGGRPVYTAAVSNWREMP